MKLFTVAVLLCLHADGLLGEECVPRDSDQCLADTPNWGSTKDCADAKKYCDSWAKDARRCCPETCGSGLLCESQCKALESKGQCIYPAENQCPNECIKETTNLGLIPMKAENFEIYYFDHPSCLKAEYTSDVFETYSVWKSKDETGDELQQFMETFKKNAPGKYQADIICGAKLMVQDTDENYVLVIITGTAMKKAVV